MIKKHLVNYKSHYFYIKTNITLKKNSMAGVEGLEPTAPGFGDRCSTN